MKIRREDLCEFTRARKKTYYAVRNSPEDWERYIEAASRLGVATDICKDAIKLCPGIGVDVLCDILRMLDVEVE